MSKETNQEQFEEFDYLSDFYFPIKEVEERHSSPILARLREKEIDPYEFLGEQKVEGTGVAKRLEDKTEIEEGKKSFSQSFLEFLKDTPESLATSTMEAGANLSNNIVQLFGFGSNMLFRGTEKGQSISDATTDFAQGYNKSTEELIGKLRKFREENDVDGITELMTDVGVDMAATVPIQKLLKKTGVPSYVATPLAFGLAYGLTGGDKEKQTNVFIDSEAINALNEALGVLPDTPEAKVAELVNTTFEGTAWGAAGNQLIKVFKILKNNVPAYMNQQTATSVGGAAATGEITNQLSDTEKKTLNFDEQSQISSPMPGDDELASAGLGPVFRSILKEAAKKIPNKGSGEQIFNTLKNTPGLKQQELKWSGLDDFLKGKKNVSKDEIQDYLKNNTLDVAEIQLPRTSKEAEALELLQIKVQGDYNRLYGRLKNLPENQGRMVDPFRFKLTNVLEDGRRINEDVTDTVLDDNFIGLRLSTYIPFSQQMSKTTNYFDKKKLIDDFGKEGDQNTLEFFMFEDSVSGRMTAVRKVDLDRVNNKTDPFSGGKFEYSHKVEMSMDEAEKYAIQKTKERIERALKKSSGDTKFGSPGYVEPGGKDYKEIIFKLKGDKSFPIEKQDIGNTNKLIKTSFPYRSPSQHFGTRNEFAHVRFKTRDLNGQKVLTVEEMQSDIVQDMKKNFGERVTDFPFKNNWYELVTKRLIRYAADNDFDAVAIPKGSTIASRYKQTLFDAKAADIQITAGANKGRFNFDITFFNKGQKASNQIMSFDETNYSKIKDIIGVKQYQKLENKFDDIVQGKILKTDDSRIINERVTFDTPKQLGTGKGKADLYDKAIPSYLKKYAKKWNAKVYDDNINMINNFKDNPNIVGTTNKIPVTIIQLTDDMKQSVQKDGQALFSIFGIGTGAAAVSDNIQNNIISQTTN